MQVQASGFSFWPSVGFVQLLEYGCLCVRGCGLTHLPNTNFFIIQFIMCSFLCVQGDGDCNFYYVWYTRAACPPHWSVDCSVMHDGKLYDLSPLSDSMSNHVVVYTLRNVKFLLNVCHSIVFGKDASCQYTSAACMVNMSNPNPTTRCALFI